MTGNIITAIPRLLLTPVKGGIRPIAVEIIRMKSPIGPVKTIVSIIKSERMDTDILL